MNKKLSVSNYVVIGTMLFGLFFGAGNLIFPLYLGQLSGSEVWVAISGFLLSGIGLPFLGVLAMGYANANGVQQLAGRIHPVYGLLFTLALYLVVGPLFALPRTGTVSYEIGIAGLLPKELRSTGLIFYTVLYFLCALYFSLNPTRVVLWVGKVLTPIFLLFILLIVIAALLAPMGDINPPIGEYIDNAFVQGILEGYNTMDALASLAFGILVVNTIKQYGVTEPKQIVAVTAKAGFFGMFLMAVIYLAIAYVGVSSVDSIGLMKNGGRILAKVTHHYAGAYGGIFLAVLIFLTCITTAIGLISACASCFHRYLPVVSYRTFAILISVFAGFMANIGLNNIISYAIPILYIICPLTLSLIMLVFLSDYFQHARVVYVMTTLFTLIASIFDSLRGIQVIFDIQQYPNVIRQILGYYELLPYSTKGLGWILPMFFGLGLGWLMAKMTPPKPALSS